MTSWRMEIGICLGNVLNGLITKGWFFFLHANIDTILLLWRVTRVLVCVRDCNRCKASVVIVRVMVVHLLSNVARVRTMSDNKTNAEPMQSGPPTTLCQMGDVRQEESPSESLHEAGKDNRGRRVKKKFTDSNKVMPRYVGFVNMKLIKIGCRQKNILVSSLDIASNISPPVLKKFYASKLFY